MFPLKKRAISGYRQGQKTFYSGWHLGTDWAANYETLYAPFDGEVINVIPKAQAKDGGNTIWFKPDHDKTLHRYLHLDRFLVGKGRVKEGEQIAITGNTGTSTNPHLHNDISRDGILRLNDRSNFIDPEKYNWNHMPTNLPIKLALNAPWQDLARQTSEVTSRYLEASAQRLNLSFEPIYTNFTNIPWEEVPGAPGYTWIRRDWMDANIVPLANGKPIVAFWLPKSQWQSNAVGWQGDHDQGPIENHFRGDEGELWPEPSMSYFVNNLCHEIGHDLKVMTGQPQNVHDFLLRDKFDLKGFCDTLDYQAVNNYLKKGTPMITVRFDDNPTKYILADELTLIGLASGTALAKTLKGRREDPKVLPASQRAAFTIADSAIN